MALAIFDLDNTLIAGDSDHSWGQFLCAEGLVDAQRFSHDNDRFYQDYQEGRLDIYAYLRFALAPLTGRSIEEVARLQQQFMRDWVEPMLLPAAFELLDKHRNRGDELVIITASNTVVTGPIAERLGVATLMGCDTEIVGGKYTGQPTGVPSFQEGKVTRLQDWLATTGHSLISLRWACSLCAGPSLAALGLFSLRWAYSRCAGPQASSSSHMDWYSSADISPSSSDKSSGCNRKNQPSL